MSLLPKVKNITSRFGINALNVMPKAHNRDPANNQLRKLSCLAIKKRLHDTQVDQNLALVDMPVAVTTPKLIRI